MKDKFNVRGSFGDVKSKTPRYLSYITAFLIITTTGLVAAYYTNTRQISPEEQEEIKLMAFKLTACSQSSLSGELSRIAAHAGERSYRKIQVHQMDEIRTYVRIRLKSNPC